MRARTLKGARCSGVVRLPTDGYAVRREKGKIQFTERNLPGICAFQSSRLVMEHAASKTVRGKPCKNAQFAVDLLSESSFQEVCGLLRYLASIYPQFVIRDLLFDMPPKHVGQQVAAFASSEKAEELIGSLGGP